MVWPLSGVRLGATGTRRTRELVLHQFPTLPEAEAFATGLVEVRISEADA